MVSMDINLRKWVDVFFMTLIFECFPYKRDLLFDGNDKKDHSFMNDLSLKSYLMLCKCKSV